MGEGQKDITLEAVMKEVMAAFIEVHREEILKLARIRIKELMDETKLR